MVRPNSASQDSIELIARPIERLEKLLYALARRWESFHPHQSLPLLLHKLFPGDRDFGSWQGRYGVLGSFF